MANVEEAWHRRLQETKQHMEVHSVTMSEIIYNILLKSIVNETYVNENKTCMALEAFFQ